MAKYFQNFHLIQQKLILYHLLLGIHHQQQGEVSGDPLKGSEDQKGLSGGQHRPRQKDDHPGRQRRAETRRHCRDRDGQTSAAGSCQYF